jgi:Holliday junction resolvase RusA-like endonuclease
VTLVASFTVDGAPVPKGRPRLSTRGGFARTYTPAKTRTFENIVREAAQGAMADLSAYGGPVELEAHFSLPIPKSWPKRDRALAIEGKIQADGGPRGGGDLDNYLKAITDGMNGVVFTDDCQIVRVIATKRYGEEPGACVSVRAL